MTATSNLKLSKTTEKRVTVLTLKLKAHWKKSTEEILEVGKCLHELKQMLSRNNFIAHIKNEIDISEKHAMRIIAAYKKFGDFKGAELLKTKPTILYELAYSCSDEQIEKIKNCGQILTNKGSVSVSQLQVKDIVPIKKKKRIELSRELATFFEEIQDEVLRFERIISYRKPLNERLALKLTIRETIECLKNFSQKI